MANVCNVCITGGAGFIGSHLADAFLARGDRVTVLDDLSGGKEENVPDGAVLERLDIRTPEAAGRVEKGGFDLLVHHAAQMDVRRSVADPVFDASVNVVGTLNLLEAAVRGGVRRVLFASTGGAIYGEQDVHPAPEEHPTRPVSPYGVAKLAVERYLFYYAVEQRPRSDRAALRQRLRRAPEPPRRGRRRRHLPGAPARRPPRHHPRRRPPDPRLHPRLGRRPGEPGRGRGRPGGRGSRGGEAALPDLQRRHRRRDLGGRPLPRARRGAGNGPGRPSTARPSRASSGGRRSTRGRSATSSACPSR